MSTDTGSLPSNEFYMGERTIKNLSAKRPNGLLRQRQNTLRAKQPSSIQDYSFTAAHTATLPSHSNYLLPNTQASIAEYPLTQPSFGQVTEHFAGSVSGPISGPLATIQKRVEDSLNDEVAPVRLAGHISVLLVAAIVLVISQTNLSVLNITPSWLTNTSDARTSELGGGILSSLPFSNSLSKWVVPFTESATALANTEPEITTSLAAIASQTSPIREQTVVYSVRQGDTVLGIAGKFNLQPETIQWSNPKIAKNPDLLSVNDELVIPPIDGVLYTIKSGETLSQIATSHKVSMDTILSFTSNGITDAGMIQPGTQIMIPGGTPAQRVSSLLAYNNGSVNSAAAAPLATGRFSWPYQGQVSQGHWSGHRALDIGGWTGTPVVAADAGKVTVAAGGWNGGYGRHVIIDHGNGFASVYAHLNTIYVNHGESINKGQQVGSLGNTGNSTGPHLHFEIRYNGRPQNPYNYLD